VSGECLFVLSGHDEQVASLSFSPLGALLASASSDCTVRIWSVSDGQCRGIVQNHSRDINKVSRTAAPFPPPHRARRLVGVV
jgi:WD40 repeat protein